MTIYEAIVNADREGRSYALATIVRTMGPAPRSAGTKMLIFEDGSVFGTVGGGSAERLVIADAVSAIRSGRTSLKLYQPDEGSKSDCRKAIEVFIEPEIIAPRIYFLGAGHVAQAVLPYAKKLGFYSVVIDPRDTTDYAEALKDADAVIRVDSFEAVSALDFVPASFVIICTYSHETDQAATCAVMDKDAAYIGILGAKHKFLPIFQKLRELGYSEERIRSIYAPIGLDLGGERPEEIGMSIMAEIMAVRYDRSAMHLRDKKRSQIFGD